MSDSKDQQAAERPGGAQEGSQGSFLKELLVMIVVVLLISFLVKHFLFRMFFIPSGSMENTLQLDDKIGVNVAEPYVGPLERGDIVVFEDTQGWLPDNGADPNPIRRGLEFVGLAPDTSRQYLIKRVIGVGGDRVECCSDGGKITVNGQAIDEPYIYEGNPPSEMEFSETVPEGEYFVMGDHRSASADSRYHIDQGTQFVPEGDVVGSGFAVLWPLDRMQLLRSPHEVFDQVPV